MKLRANLFAGLAALVLLTGCAETQLASHIYKKSTINGREAEGYQPPSRQQGNFKIGNPYKVDGKWYTPQETYSYSETGIASWYGPGFQGKKTANGERFDTRELTAAHRTLQMPSLVRVTNLDNGRSVVVRINDRGPFKRGRIIDVSERAAELLGFKGNGTAKVRVDLLADESKLLAMAAQRGESTKGMEVALADGRGGGYQNIAIRGHEEVVPGHMNNGQFFPDPVVSQLPVQRTSIYVQAGSFSQVDNANALARNLGAFGKTRVAQALVNGRQFYRVQIGPVANVQQADTLLSRVAGAGHKDAIIVVD